MTGSIRSSPARRIVDGRELPRRHCTDSGPIGVRLNGRRLAGSGKRETKLGVLEGMRSEHSGNEDAGPPGL
jgi:hypothetical protein